MKNLARYRKTITALVGALVQAAALGLLPSAYVPWVTVLVGILTAAGVYVTPNQATPPTRRKPS